MIDYLKGELAELTPAQAIVEAYGVGYAIALMFLYYIYVFWFCNFGSKIGLSKK